MSHHTYCLPLPCVQRRGSVLSSGKHPSPGLFPLTVPLHDQLLLQFLLWLQHLLAVPQLQPVQHTFLTHTFVYYYKQMLQQLHAPVPVAAFLQRLLPQLLLYAP